MDKSGTAAKDDKTEALFARDKPEKLIEFDSQNHLSSLSAVAAVLLYFSNFFQLVSNFLIFSTFFQLFSNFFQLFSSFFLND